MLAKYSIIIKKIHHRRPYYSWSFDWPEGGIIRFGAIGFTMRPGSEPIETASQLL